MNKEGLFSRLLNECEPFIKATAFRFEKKVRSIPENYATLKASAVVYDREDYENSLRICLYRLMNTALEKFEDASAVNIARTFTTSGIAMMELCSMVSPHKNELFAAFSFDSGMPEVAMRDDAIEDFEFETSMREVTSDKPDAYVLYDLIMNQPENFILWCSERAQSLQRNRVKGTIPNACMKEYLKETRGWSYYRFETAMRVLREKAKEVIAV